MTWVRRTVEVIFVSIAVATMARASELEALLTAIRLYPDEDTPRLACADWLEEHGDTARAEFIQKQVALTQMNDDYLRGRALKRRVAELHTQNQSRWNAPSPTTVNHFNFSRGFLSTLQLEGLLETLPAARLDSPENVVTHLTVEIASARNLDAFAHALLPRFRSLRSLHIRASFPFGNEDEETTARAMELYQELFASEVFQGVEHLEFFGGQPVLSLLIATRLPKLKSLHTNAWLSGNTTQSPLLVQGLVRAPNWPALRALDLVGLYQLPAGLLITLIEQLRSPAVSKFASLRLVFGRDPNFPPPPELITASLQSPTLRTFRPVVYTLARNGPQRDWREQLNHTFCDYGQYVPALSSGVTWSVRVSADDLTTMPRIKGRGAPPTSNNDIWWSYTNP